MGPDAQHLRTIRRLLTLVLTLAIAAATGAAASPRAQVTARDIPPSRHILMWANCNDVAQLSDAQLDYWHALGIGGFACQTQWLKGMGGTDRFTAGPESSQSGDWLQTQLAESRLSARAHARGMQLYLGFYLTNYYNTQTPLGEWFDAAYWTHTVLPAVGAAAAAAHRLGFDGLAFDEEMYPQTGGVSSATWSWDYPGNTHAEQAVRTQVAMRGQQMMRTILAAFPQASIVDYGTRFPGTWAAYVQQAENHTVAAFSDSVQINFWNGLTQINGYRSIRFLDASFYKDPGASGASWQGALSYSTNAWYSVMSRNFRNWAYAAPRVAVTPFAWIDGDAASEGSWAQPRSPSYVTGQLAALTQWAPDGDFAIYSYDPLGQFDYGPYRQAILNAAASPVTAATDGPQLTVDSSSARHARRTLVLRGSVQAAKAIRYVDWHAGRQHGAATMNWVPTSGNPATGYTWHTQWAARGVPASAKRLTICAVDLDGQAASRHLVIRKGPRGRPALRARGRRVGAR